MDNMPSKPITMRTREGEYSTIRYPDGLVETILFSHDGNAIATKRTFQGVRSIQEEHIRLIRDELNHG